MNMSENRKDRAKICSIHHLYIIYQLFSLPRFTGQDRREASIWDFRVRKRHQRLEMRHSAWTAADCKWVLDIAGLYCQILSIRKFHCISLSLLHLNILNTARLARLNMPDYASASVGSCCVLSHNQNHVTMPGWQGVEPDMYGAHQNLSEQIWTRTPTLVCFIHTHEFQQLLYPTNYPYMIVQNNNRRH